MQAPGGSHSIRSHSSQGGHTAQSLCPRPGDRVLPHLSSSPRARWPWLVGTPDLALMGLSNWLGTGTTQATLRRWWDPAPCMHTLAALTDAGSQNPVHTPRELGPLRHRSQVLPTPAFCLQLELCCEPTGAGTTGLTVSVPFSPLMRPEDHR